MRAAVVRGLGARLGRARGEERGGRGVLAALVCADVAFAFQQTAVVPAIPRIESDLHAAQAWSAWLLTGYLVASAVATPLLAKLGDRHGRRRALIGSLAGFLVGSIGAAFAPDLAVLIVFRAVQGIGGAVFPLTLSLARDHLDEDRVQFGVGLLTGAFGVGTSLGFGVSGVIVEQLSWRYLFAAGAAGVAVAIAGVLLTPTAGERRREGRIDLPGTLLLAAGLSLLLIALTVGIPRGFGSVLVVGAFAVSAALLAAWMIVDLRVDDPLLDLQVLARPAVLLTNVTTLALGYALFGTYFLLPYLVEGGGAAGISGGPLAAGLYLLPGAIGQAASGPAAAALARRISAKWIAGGGMAMVAAGAALLAVWHDTSWQLVLFTLLLGTGAGAALSVISDLITELVEPTETGAATGLNSTLRRVAGGVGSQVGAIILAAFTVRAGGPSGGAFVLAFAITAAAAAAGAAAALAIRPGGPEGA
jgi:MFS family permease